MAGDWLQVAAIVVPVVLAVFAGACGAGKHVLRGIEKKFEASEVRADRRLERAEGRSDKRFDLLDSNVKAVQENLDEHERHCSDRWEKHLGGDLHQ